MIKCFKDRTRGGRFHNCTEISSLKAGVIKKRLIYKIQWATAVVLLYIGNIKINSIKKWVILKINLWKYSKANSSK